MNPYFLLLEIKYILPSLVFKIIASLSSGFLAITFSQSALDKITDFKGNKTYFESQFGKTFLHGMVGMLLRMLIFLEANTALACIAGNFLALFKHNVLLMGYGLISGAITLMCLLLGQRIAKDYAGAASLTGYFIISILGLIGVAACL
jgi:hypothetical protein